MVFDVWNNAILIRLCEQIKHFNAFLLLIRDFHSVVFCTEGPVCMIWQQLAARIATCVLGLRFKGDLKEIIRNPTHLTCDNQEPHLQVVTQQT